jgi:uncharacterized protein
LLINTVWSQKVIEMAELLARKWLMEAIVSKKLYGRALCPFAASVVHTGLRVSVTDAKTNEDLLKTVEEELQLIYPCNNILPSRKPPETTILIVPHMFNGNYRSMIHFSWKIMEIISSSESYQGKLQVVNFHPEGAHSLFAVDDENPADYTVRSPMPIFHFLREEDILKAVQSSYPQPDEIPSRNAKLLHELGIDEVRKRFDSLLS